MDSLKIYFAGAIRGGREQASGYRDIIRYLKEIGQVFTEHVGDDERLHREELELSDQEIYQRDMKWLEEADCLIAEVSNPSLGVGYEIARSISMRKPVLCLFNEYAERKLSAMIAGSHEVNLVRYKTFEELIRGIDKFILEFRERQASLN